MTRKRKIDWLNHGLEFIIVVVGILLAFQLNTCSEEKKQRSILDEHLASIEEETFFNLKSLRSSINYGAQELKNMDSLLYLINNDQNTTAMNILSFKLLRVGRVHFQKNAYNTLETSGDIRHIEDFALKEEIINLYEYYKWTESIEKVNLEFYSKRYYPYLLDNFDMLYAQPQDKSIYLAQKFKNLLSAYKYQTIMRTKKYNECYQKIETFIENRNWISEDAKDVK